MLTFLIIIKDKQLNKTYNIHFFYVIQLIRYEGKTRP